MKKNKSTLLLLIIASFALGAFSNQKFFANITADDVRKAAKIIGLDFSQPEIDSLRSGLDELKESYAANRAISLNNSVVPAIQFNPYPAGFNIPTKNGPKGFSGAEEVISVDSKARPRGEALLGAICIDIRADRAVLRSWSHRDFQFL